MSTIELGNLSIGEIIAAKSKGRRTSSSLIDVTYLMQSMQQSKIESENAEDDETVGEPKAVDSEVVNRHESETKAFSGRPLILDEGYLPYSPEDVPHYKDVLRTGQTLSKGAEQIAERALQNGVDPKFVTEKVQVAAEAAQVSGKRKIGFFGGARNPLEALRLKTAQVAYSRSKYLH